MSTETFSPAAYLVDQRIMAGHWVAEYAPTRAIPQGIRHDLEHLSEHGGVACSTYPMTFKKLVRSIAVYGFEGMGELLARFGENEVREAVSELLRLKKAAQERAEAAGQTP